MTWAEFKAKVTVFLDVEANRFGFEQLRLSFTKAAVIDLKHFVLAFKDGVTDYADTDEVPFEPNEDKVAEVVSYYVKSKFARIVEKDLNLMESYKQDYMTGRRWLMRECSITANVNSANPVIPLKPGDSLILDFLVKVDNRLYNLDGIEGAWIYFKSCCEMPDDEALVRRSLGDGIQATKLYDTKLQPMVCVLRITVPPALTSLITEDCSYSIRIKADGGDVFSPDGGEGDVVVSCSNVQQPI